MTKQLDMVLRNLEVIGEAVNPFPPDFRDAHSSVEWRRIAGVRDILIHQYSGIDLDILWDILTHKLPAFHSEVREISDQM